MTYETTLALRLYGHRLAERNRSVITPLPVMSGLDAPGSPCLRRPDPYAQTKECYCCNSTVSASSRTRSYHTRMQSSREPAAAYGLAPYAICVRLQPRLMPSLHPAPNSTGQLMNARFSLCANFNVITRPKDAAGDIYICSLGAVVLPHASFLM